MDRPEKADWYSKEDYNKIRQDWEHGQVLQPAMDGILFRESDPFGYRNWNGWEVNSKGYLTGNKARIALNGLGPMEYMDGAGEIKVLESLKNGKALLKEGDYFLYWGTKKEVNYIGSTDNLGRRYNADELRELVARPFEFFINNPSIRMPNAGIKIGVEQLVLRLNNAGENITKAKIGVNLANKMNAAVKEIYISEAFKWISKNVPDWKNVFLLKK